MSQSSKYYVQTDIGYLGLAMLLLLLDDRLSLSKVMLEVEFVVEQILYLENGYTCGRLEFIFYKKAKGKEINLTS